MGGFREGCLIDEERNRFPLPLGRKALVFMAREAFGVILAKGNPVHREGQEQCRRKPPSIRARGGSMCGLCHRFLARKQSSSLPLFFHVEWLRVRADVPPAFPPPSPFRSRMPG